MLNTHQVKVCLKKGQLDRRIVTWAFYYFLKFCKFVMQIIFIVTGVDFYSEFQETAF